jgi:hypothetical protein
MSFSGGSSCDRLLPLAMARMFLLAHNLSLGFELMGMDFARLVFKDSTRGSNITKVKVLDSCGTKCGCWIFESVRPVQREDAAVRQCQIVLGRLSKVPHRIAYRMADRPRRRGDQPSHDCCSSEAHQ